MPAMVSRFRGRTIDGRANRPITWKPTDILEVTNVSDENVLLDSAQRPLAAGHRPDDPAPDRQRAGKPQVNALSDRNGKLKVAAVQTKVTPCHPKARPD